MIKSLRSILSVVILFGFGSASASDLPVGVANPASSLPLEIIRDWEGLDAKSGWISAQRFYLRKDRKKDDEVPGFFCDKQTWKAIVSHKLISPKKPFGLFIYDGNENEFKHLTQFECLEILDISNRGLDHDGMIFSAPPIKISSVGMKSLIECKKLKYLNIGNVAIDDDLAKSIGLCTQIIGLNLNKCEVSDLNIEKLANNKNISRLILSSTPINGDGLLALSQCDITHIDLSYSNVRDSGLRALAFWKNLKNVELQFTQVTSDSLKHLVKCKQIELLNIAQTSIDDRSCEIISSFKQLLNLDLSFTSLTDVGVSKLFSTRSLQVLKIAGTKVGDAGMKDIIWLTQLRHLDLRSTKISNAAIDAIANIKSLEHLDVRSTQISNNGLLKLSGHMALKYINVYGTKVDEDTIDKFIKLNPGIRVVNKNTSPIP